MDGRPRDDVCITLDVDWASDPVLAGALALIEELDVPVTLFCTHRTSLLEGLDPGRFEIAWHPNFLDPRDDAEIVAELAAWFPGALGVRAHALYFHSRLAPLYLQRGIRYLAHELQFAQPRLAPLRHWSGLVGIPGFWEDDVHALYHGGDFDPDRVDLESPGLKVFDFHPIHLALNTDTIDRYEAARADIEERRSLAEHVNPGLGSRTLLRAVVERLRGDPVRHRFTTVGDVAQRFDREHPYPGRYHPAD
jgi:hypothetical protein